MLYVDDGRLKADDVMVVSGDRVQALVAAGWRILGILGQSAPGPTVSSYISWSSDHNSNHNGNVDIPGAPVFVPAFIMGRDGDDATLHARMQDAEERVEEARKLSEQINREARDWAGKHRDVENRLAISVELVGRKSDEYRALKQEVEKVRQEIGEARWREILGSLEVEQVLEGKAPAPGDDDDGVVPF